MGRVGGTASLVHMLQGFLLPLRHSFTTPGKPRSVGAEGSEIRDETELQEPERRQGLRASGLVGSKVRESQR